MGPEWVSAEAAALHLQEKQVCPQISRVTGEKDPWGLEEIMLK